MRAREFLYESGNDLPGFKNGVLSIKNGYATIGPLTIRYAPSIRGVTYWINDQPVGCIQGKTGAIPKNSAEPYPVQLNGAEFTWYEMPDTALDEPEKFIGKKLPGAVSRQAHNVSFDVFRQMLEIAIQEA